MRHVNPIGTASIFRPFCPGYLLAIVSCAFLGACSTASVPTLTNSVPAIPTPVQAAAFPAADSLVVNGPPTEVYSAVAQKALACWMGADGPLKPLYIFHAEAASPTTGGKAEIVLHERDKSQPHPWGARAFRIELSAEGGGTDTRLALTNIKLPKDLEEAVRTDIGAWAQGRESCQVRVVRPPPPPQPAAKTKGKPRTKSAKAG